MPIVAHHLVHLNKHLEVYIIRHTHRAGKKTRSVLAQTPMSLFAVPMDARTCHFHRTVGYLENGCRKIRMSRVKSNDDGEEEDDDDVDDDDVDDDDGDGDDDETLRRGCCVKRLTRHMARVPFEGGRGGSLSPGRSRIRGPARPFASQSKTQGSPLGGYLSWLFI